MVPLLLSSLEIPNLSWGRQCLCVFALESAMQCFTFSVVHLTVSHRACFKTASPSAKAVFSGDLSVPGGCGDTQGLC